MASEAGFLISSLSVAQRDLAFASRIARHEHRAFDGLFRAWPAVGHAVAVAGDLASRLRLSQATIAWKLASCGASTGCPRIGRGD